MVQTRKNVYPALEKEKVPGNLDRLNATFNELTSIGSGETILAWQKTMQSNMTSVVAYNDENETRISKIKHDVRELQDALELQIQSTLKMCTDQINRKPHFQDLIRRKELDELEESIDAKLSILGRKVNEYTRGAHSSYFDVFFEKITKELDQQSLEGIFQNEDQNQIFIKTCYFTVNGLFKAE